MKKIMLTALFAVVVLVSTNAQNFGVTAGYLNMEAKVKGDGESIGVDDSGFYVGGFARIPVSEVLDFQPGLQYASIDGDSFLLIPLLLSYKVAEKFNLNGGGQFDYVLEDAEGMKKMGIGLAFGGSFDITPAVALEARYSLGLNNRLKDEWGGNDITVKFNTFQVGLAYKF